MINVAGRTDTDKICIEELQIAEIDYFQDCVKPYGEGKGTVFGMMGYNKTSFNQECLDMAKRFKFLVSSFEDNCSFFFTRTWYYWIVKGYVPENVALDIYNDSRNNGVVRINGHCGNPSPKEFGLTSYKIAGKYCADMYHIDTQLGLKIFMDHIKKNELI